MINQMGASGAAADALFQQFTNLQGFRANEISNAPGAAALNSGIGGGYGCWCHFGNAHLEVLGTGEAKGPPLDDLDSFCHDLWRGYECARLDVDGCVPWDIDYSTTDDITSIGSNPSDITTMCRQNNADTTSCAFVACTVEAWFLKQVDIRNGANFGITADMITNEYKHNDADWDSLRPTICKGTAKDGDHLPVCCGTYPERGPYNDLAPNKICCTDNTGLNSDVTGTPSSPTNVVETYVYNTANEQCCANGKVLQFGTGETC